MNAKTQVIKEETRYDKQRKLIFDYGVIEFINDNEFEMQDFSFSHKMNLDGYVVHVNMGSGVHAFLITYSPSSRSGSVIWISPTIQYVDDATLWLSSDLNHLQTLNETGRTRMFTGEVWRNDHDGHPFLKCRNIKYHQQEDTD